MGKEISQSDVMRAFLCMSLDYGQELMAGKLDIKVSTLSNKVQPYNHAERRHFLNLWEADDMLSLSGDMRPLELMAARHGFALLPLKATPDAPTLDAEKLQDYIAITECHAEEDPIKRVYKLNAAIRELMETDAKRKEGE